MTADPFDSIVDALPVFPEPAVSTIEVWHRAVQPKPSYTQTAKFLRGWSGAAMGLERFGGKVGAQFYRYHDDWDTAEKAMGGVDIDAVHFAKKRSAPSRPKLGAADASITEGLVAERAAPAKPKPVDQRAAQREVISRHVSDAAEAKQPKPAPRDLPMIIPANVKITRGPAFTFDARYQIDPAARISGGFLDEWRKLRGELAA